MPNATRMAYVAVEDATNLAPTLLSLQEQGFHFNGPLEMASWFEEQGIPFQVKPLDKVFFELSQPDSTLPLERIFILYSYGHPGIRFTAEREALVSYLLTTQAPSTLLVTNPLHYRLLKPEILGDKSQWPLISRQLYQDVRPHQILSLQKVYCAGDIERPLYSSNPAWVQAIEVLTSSPRRTLSDAQLKNVLTGSQLLIHLARTEGVHSSQAILLQHGMPVHVACSGKGIAAAIEKVLYQESQLTPGATLVASHPIPAETMKHLLQAGIQVAVSTRWEEDVLAEVGSGIIPVAFHLKLLQISPNHLLPMNSNTVLFEPASVVDDRQLTWFSKEKPTHDQLLDLEIAMVIAESLPQCAAVMVHKQNSLVVSSGMPLPLEAVDHCLTRISGESKGAVCVITGEVYSEHIFNLLAQARISGLLLLHPVEFPEAMVQCFKNLPLFVGTYAATGISPLLDRVEVRHG